MTCTAKERARKMIEAGFSKEEFKADLQMRLDRAKRQASHCERMLALIAERESA